MCGIFGFITRDGDGPSISRLRRIAAVTERRGAHAFGLAWLDASNQIRTFKRPGAATDCLGDLSQCRGASVVLGRPFLQEREALLTARGVGPTVDSGDDLRRRFVPLRTHAT